MKTSIIIIDPFCFVHFSSPFFRSSLKIAPSFNDQSSKNSGTPATAPKKPPNRKPAADNAKANQTSQFTKMKVNIFFHQSKIKAKNTVVIAAKTIPSSVPWHAIQQGTA